MPEMDASNFQRLSPEEVASLLERGEEIFVVDLREPRAFHAGHIPDAISLPADDFADRYGRELSPDDRVVLICEKGLTSQAAAKYLLTQGFTDVATMEGGMNAWTGERTKPR